jgi:methionine-rich copper-binding protein CopC
MNKQVVRHLTRYLCVVLLGLGWLWVASGGTAHAQADVIKATPKPDGRVKEIPTTVTLETSENIKPDPAVSNILVYGPHGTLVSQGNAEIDPSLPRKMIVHFKSDGEGSYVVQWKTVSTQDNKATQGAFTFMVAEEQNNIPLAVMMIISIFTLVLGIIIGSGLGYRRAITAARLEAGNSSDDEPTS